MSKRVVFFIEGRNVPASRFRILQFLPRLEADGHSVVVCATRPPKYLWYPKQLRRSAARWPFVVLGLLMVVVQRLFQIALYCSRSDVVVLQRDLLFRVPSAFLERLAVTVARGMNPSCRVVFDIDDAIYLGADGAPSAQMAAKVSSIAALSDVVIAGNQTIASFFPSEVSLQVIPTVVEVGVAGAIRPALANQLPIIGWSGTAANLPALASIASALREIYRQCRFELVVMTESGHTSPFANDDFPVRMVPWTASQEEEIIASFDIGIMPLPNTAWNRAKCGFKLIQYMAQGVPAVASPVGVNAEIVTDQEDGFLAASEAQWTEVSLKLLRDPALRRRIGDAGRRRVDERYSVRSIYPRWRECVITD